MTGPELRALPEVDCPQGGAECCGYLYYGRRICSYPMEAHLQILLRMCQKRERDLAQLHTEHWMVDERDWP